MLDFKEIKEKYPKSYKLLLNWTKETLLSFQRLLMGDLDQSKLPVIEDATAESALDGFIKVNYRLLFSFFDINKVYIEIPVNINGKDVEFQAVVNQDYRGDHVYTNRELAEFAAINHAFETLESKL